MRDKLVNWIQTVDDAIIKYINSKKRRNLKPLMDFLSHPPYWRPAILMAIIISLVVWGKPAGLKLLYLALVITLSDQTCNLLKALVKRVRPDGLRNTEGSIWRKLGYYSFPSSHAANTFAAATLLSGWYPLFTLRLSVYCLAGLISFSRLYHNNHYPSDVLAGGIIGIGYGVLFLNLLF